MTARHPATTVSAVFLSITISKSFRPGCSAGAADKSQPGRLLRRSRQRVLSITISKSCRPHCFASAADTAQPGKLLRLSRRRVFPACYQNPSDRVASPARLIHHSKATCYDGLGGVFFPSRYHSSSARSASPAQLINNSQACCYDGFGGVFFHHDIKILPPGLLCQRS